MNQHRKLYEPELSREAEVAAEGPPFLPVLWLLWRQRRFLARVSAWGLVLATAVAFLIPKRYEATARLVPPDPQSLSAMAMLAGVTGTGNPGVGNLGGLASSLLGMKNTSAMFVGILQSRTVADHLIDRFDLRKVYWKRSYQDTRKKLAKRTEIEDDRKSGIITVSVTDNDPRRAQQMAAAYVDELNHLVALLNISAAHRERVFLEQRLAEVKQDLDVASREFSQYSSKNSTLDLREQGKAIVDAAAMLQGQLIASQSELRGLEQIYTPDNYRVRAARARVNELQAQLRKLSGRPGDGNPAELPADELYPSIRELPLVGIRYADLYRRVKVQETLFEVLTKQYELAKLQEAKETPTVRVLDAPVVPEKKSFPPRLLIMIMGTLLAFVAASAWIAADEAWRRTPDTDPKKTFALEVGGAVKNLLRLGRNRLPVSSSKHRSYD
ncbi:MAG: GumC family protein [Terriglobales bacterium]